MKYFKQSYSQYIKLSVIFYQITSSLSLVLPSSVTVNKDAPALKFIATRFLSPEKVIWSPDQGQQHLIEKTDQYQKSNATILLQGTDFKSEEFSKGVLHLDPSPSFTHSVFHAYKNHHNLIIRPDDVWAAILVQFSYYVNANSEKLRTEFVNFDEKKDLSVNYTGIGVQDVPFDHFINEMVSLIEDNITPNTSLWVLPNFSTTTKNDRVTAGALLMATVKNYFNYHLGIILCGIPEITLLGTVKDWKEIRQRVALLPKYEVDQENLPMQKWSLLLTSVLNNFVQVKETGVVDYKFWENVARHHSDIEGCAGFSYLNGWITVFSVFDTKGRWQGNMEHSHEHIPSKDLCIKNGSFVQGDLFSSPWPTLNVNDIPSGVVEVPINIKDDGAVDLLNGEYKGVIFAGHLGHAIREDEVTAACGWMGSFN